MARRREFDDLPLVPLSKRTLHEALQLARYLWPYRLRLLVGLIALAISSSLALAFPQLAGSLVDSAQTGQTMAPRISLPWQQDVNAVALTLAAVLACQALFSFVQAYLFNEVGARGLTDLRRDTYGRLIRLPMGFFAGRRVGELSGRLAADLSQIQETLATAVPQLLRQIAFLVGGVVLIALISLRLTLVMMVSLPPLIAVAVTFGRKIRRTAREGQDRLGDSNVVVEETLQGVATVKAFTSEAHEQNRYGSALQAFLTVALRGARYRGMFVSFVVFGLFGGIVVVLWYGARLVQEGSLKPGELMSVMLYAVFVGGAMGSFAEFYSQMLRTLGATQRVRELLREPAEESDASGTGPGPRLRGEVAFEDVTFAYQSRKEVTVLRGLSLAARPGERIALVGPSGAGKSTTVAILLRFYDPDGGRVLVDGRDAREYLLHELRGQIAVVPQDVLLFGGTIAENIAYGRRGATEDEIIEAARQANADGFIRSFPDGYKTLVGERGVQLSGGQRQRVAIARAILKNPAILVLDEATSSLDAESEGLVQQALDRLMEGRTSLVIAHRLATVRKADRIFVMREGRVVESGTHEELIGQEEGLYRMLSEMQFDMGKTT
jgi:ABC-type multidrug transport system fused ATPase/permease subunit